jgi:hypothetical protein
VLDETGEFRRIYRKAGHEKGLRIGLLPSRGAGRRKERALRNAIALVSCFVVFTGAYLFSGQWDGMAYALYVDINPSVKLQVNNYDQIISQQSMNPDGEQLLDNARPSGSVATAIDRLVKEASQSGFNMENGISITMVGGSDKKYEWLSGIVSRSFGGMKVQVVYVTPEEEQAALDYGVPPYRYLIAKQASAILPDLALDTAVHLPISFLESIVAANRQPE